MNELDQDAVNLARAIREVESGGKFNAKGASGEYGAYQFTPATWNNYSKKHLGQAIPLEKATPQQQNEVVYKQIKAWKDNNNNVGQIASMWNAGEGRPNAYKEGWKGVNDYGVSYDTPAYAEKVAKAYQSLKGRPLSIGGGAGVIAGAVEQTPDARGLGEKLKDELKYAIGNKDQETPTGLSAGIQGAQKIIEGDIGSGVADIGRGGLNVLGAVGGAIGDFIGAGVSKVLPDEIEQSIGNAFGKITGTQEVQDVFKSIDAWAKANPKSANAAGDIFNVVTTLLPAARSIGAAKNMLTGGMAQSVARTSAGRQLLNQTKAEGIDLFKSAKQVMDAAPKSMWSTMTSPVSGTKYYADDLAGVADDMLQTARKEMKTILAQEKRTANISDIAEYATGYAKRAFDGDGNVEKSLRKAFGSSLDRASDVNMADLMRYAESPNANPYVQKAVEEVISQTQSKALKQAQQKAMQAEASKRLFEMLSGTRSEPSMARGLAAQGAEYAGTHLGRQFGSTGAYMGNKAGEVLGNRILGNQKGLISKAQLENATRGRALKNLGKQGMLPVLANLGNN